MFCLQGSLGGTETHTAREASVFGAAEPHTLREASVCGEPEPHTAREAPVFGAALRSKLWDKGLESPDGKAWPA